jgi:hypothetical protein
MRRSIDVLFIPLLTHYPVCQYYTFDVVVVVVVVVAYL